jgi:AcrR family transcriptional regulator
VGRSRTPGQRAGLTRTAVLAAARDLLATGGLEALTMRAVAERLDVAPNALYSHVASKTALVDDLLDDVLAGVEASATEVGDPRTGLRRLMASTYDLLLAHPDLVPLYLARQGARGPNAQRLGHIVDTLLARAGIHGTAVGEARRVLIVYTIGFAAFATRPPVDGTGDPPLTADELLANFTRGLRWLVAGIVPPARPSRRR